EAAARPAAAARTRRGRSPAASSRGGGRGWSPHAALPLTVLSPQFGHFACDEGPSRRIRPAQKPENRAPRRRPRLRRVRFTGGNRATAPPGDLRAGVPRVRFTGGNRKTAPAGRRPRLPRVRSRGGASGGAEAGEGTGLSGSRSAERDDRFVREAGVVAAGGGQAGRRRRGDAVVEGQQEVLRAAPGAAGADAEVQVRAGRVAGVAGQPDLLPGGDRGAVGDRPRREV